MTKERFTPYDLEYQDVICTGVDWENYEFKFTFKGKAYNYKQKEYISCSADTDHIRYVIEEFKQNLLEQLLLIIEEITSLLIG